MTSRTGPYQVAPEQRPHDALDTLVLQNRLIIGLLNEWSVDADRLHVSDDVDLRWEQGSLVKLLLEHLAVREEAKGRVAEALAECGRADLAGSLEADGPARRRDIRFLETEVRGTTGININSHEVEPSLRRIESRVRREISDEVRILRAAEGILGPPEDRELPSDLNVRTHAVTRPSPVPRWFDKIGALKMARAFYEQLRTSPHGGYRPKVDKSREWTPSTPDSKE